MCVTANNRTGDCGSRLAHGPFPKQPCESKDPLVDGEPCSRVATTTLNSVVVTARLRVHETEMGEVRGPSGWAITSDWELSRAYHM